jgi:Asp-tRNA(Asn)/Glu-tRNA(Gln) amidotransferase A subunit family amidase
MTGYPDDNREAFRHATHWLRSKGYAVVSPDELDELQPTKEKTWKAYMKRDIPWAVNADIAYALPGWRESRGARLEACLMRALEVPMFEMVEKDKRGGWMRYDSFLVPATDLPVPSFM